MELKSTGKLSQMPGCRLQAERKNYYFAERGLPNDIGPAPVSPPPCHQGVWGVRNTPPPPVQGGFGRASPGKFTKIKLYGFEASVVQILENTN